MPGDLRYQTVTNRKSRCSTRVLGHDLRSELRQCDQDGQYPAQRGLPWSLSARAEAPPLWGASPPDGHPHRPGWACSPAANHERQARSRACEGQTYAPRLLQAQEPTSQGWLDRRQSRKGIRLHPIAQALSEPADATAGVDTEWSGKQATRMAASKPAGTTQQSAGGGGFGSHPLAAGRASGALPGARHAQPIHTVDRAEEATWQADAQAAASE